MEKLELNTSSVFPLFICRGCVMRSAVCGFLLLSLSCAALAQSQLKAQVGAEPQSRAVTLDDLQGMTVLASQSYAARFRNARGEASGGFKQQWEFKIGPGTVLGVKFRRDAWWDTPNGRKTGHVKRSTTHTIGEPTQRPDGRGAGLYLFEDSTLKGLLVLETGGGILKVTFENSVSGLSCVTAAAMAQEVGGGPTKARRGTEVEDGGQAVILSAKPTAATCKVQATQ
jgi:hypothetical protein